MSGNDVVIGPGAEINAGQGGAGSESDPEDACPAMGKSGGVRHYNNHHSPESETQRVGNAGEPVCRTHRQCEYGGGGKYNQHGPTPESGNSHHAMRTSAGRNCTSAHPRCEPGGYWA